MRETIVHKIDKEFNSLAFIKSLKEFDVFLIDEFDIDPFEKWSIGFSSEYWYLSYHLLKDGKFKLNFEDDELIFLYKEENLNINFMTITDFENFKVQCVDGDWRIEFLNNSDKTKEFLFEIFDIEAGK